MSDEINQRCIGGWVHYKPTPITISVNYELLIKQLEERLGYALPEEIKNCMLWMDKNE